MKQFVLVVCLILSGCAARNPSGTQPTYTYGQVARDAIVATRAFLAKAQENHFAECQSQCTLPTIKDQKFCRGLCNAINLTVRLHNVAVRAMDAYCVSPEWQTGGVCMGDSAKEPELKNAVDEMVKARMSAEKLGGGQ